ncbi:hypothetical protein K3495_g5939 [Podosphaera aphanis]|nr:hypothetical protein K3495_g5939 [Podosphaera aphanis]
MRKTPPRESVVNGSYWIRTSFLLSRVGHVSKLPRLYLGERPGRCTTPPSDPSGGTEESEITIPSSWLNNYDRAAAAAQQFVDNLPQLKHVKPEDPPQVESLSPQIPTLSSQGPSWSNYNDPPKPVVQQPSCGAITMNEQQLSDFVQSIM